MQTVFLVFDHSVISEPYFVEAFGTLEKAKAYIKSRANDYDSEDDFGIQEVEIK
jgi:hypothetical protein